MGGAFYGSGGGLIYDISCNTSGNTTDCEYKPASNISNCSHANDAGVVCTGTRCIFLCNALNLLNASFCFI